MQSTPITPEDIVIEAGTVYIEGLKPLEPYTPPETITLETVTFEPTTEDETKEIALEAELNAKEKELEAFLKTFRDKELEHLETIKNLSAASESDKIAYFSSDSFALVTISRNNENLGDGTELETLYNDVNTAVPTIFTEFETLYGIMTRLFETYDLYKEFEDEVYKAYYMKGVNPRPTVDMDKWKLQLVSFQFDGNTSTTWDEETNGPFIFEDLRKLYQDQYRHGMGKLETQITATMAAIDEVQRLREKELAKYVELVSENNIDRKNYLNEQKTKLDLILGDAVTKAESLKTDLNNESLSREVRINKGEQLYSINVLYQALKAIKVILDDWTTKIDDNAADVADWNPILLSAARHPFNELRLWVSIIENLAKKVSIEITMPGYEIEFQMDDVIYGMQRTELDVFNSSMLLNTIRTKENRDKCFGAQFEVIAGVTCAMLAGNASSYFTLAPAPSGREGGVGSGRILNEENGGETPAETPAEEASIFHEQAPTAIPMKSDAKLNIVYNCFPQLYSQCKVINTLGDLNMIRHLIPEASLQDKVDICTQKEKISECFLDWSKCQQAFQDEIFNKLFSPFVNKLNNLNTDDYETDVDKTKGFLDSQLLLLGVDINSARKQIVADMENHLNQSEPFRFKMNNGKYQITALNAAAFLRNLEDTEKINYFMGEEYLDADLKTPPPADSGRILATQGFKLKKIANSERILKSSETTTSNFKESLRNHDLFVNNLNFEVESKATHHARILNADPAPAYLSLAYEINDTTGLDLRVWARESGLNYANLESKMTGLPNIPEPVAVSINNPGGDSNTGGDDNAGNTANGDGATGDGTTSDKSVVKFSVSWVSLMIAYCIFGFK